MSESEAFRCPYCGNANVMPPGALSPGQTIQCAACGRAIVVGAALSERSFA